MSSSGKVKSKAVVLDDAENYWIGTTKADEVRGGYGDDTLSGRGGNDKLHGDENDDKLYGEDGADVLDGGSGDDYLAGGIGADQALGGLGDDYFYFANSDEGTGDRIDGGLGTDALDYNYTGAGALVFAAIGPRETQKIAGLTITGIEQWILHGDAGDDRITGWRLADQLYGWNGDDTLKGLDGDDTLYGETGQDDLDGGLGDDDLFGGDDADKLAGGLGDDYLRGGTGNDTLDGGEGIGILYGDGGADVVRGGGSADYLYSDGTEDYDVQIDRLYAGGGDDTVTMGVRDIAEGEEGVDTIRLTLGGVSVAESFAIGDGLIQLNTGGSFTGFEALQFEGGSGKDRVTGGAYADSLEGGLGDDTLSGGGAVDILDGGAGDDVLHGDDGDDAIGDSDGADQMYGDAGRDTFTVSGTDGMTDLIDGGADWDNVEFGQLFETMSAYVDLMNQGRNAGYARGDTYVGIEEFDGSGKDDVLLGDNRSNAFYGGYGADVLSGRGGDDVLVGGAGADVMTGGTGRDTFSLSDSSESFPYDWRGDEITDFVHGEDTIVIDGAKMGFPGGEGFRLISGTDPAPDSASPTLLFDARTHELWWDVDGTGAHDAVLVATFDGVTQLVAADFAIL